MMNRRTFMARLAGGLVFSAAGDPWAAVGRDSGTAITVYKSPTCGCCTKWVDHLRANGFAPNVHDTDDMDAMKDDMGVPKGLRSCHTALLGPYLIEGHVPADDLHRLLAERPKVAGLAVPGMPHSTPGMAVPGEAREPYEVVSFTRDGKSALFARH
jgi:hypothetical protein